MASPRQPLSQLRRSLPSFFMWPIAGSMALLRRIALQMVGVTPPFLSASPDRHSVNADAAIAFVDKHGLGHPVGQNADLLNGFR